MKKPMVKFLLRLLGYGTLLALFFSLASPMVEQITIQYICDKDRAKMHCLKTSLVTFKSDMGYLPFAGHDDKDSDAYFSSINAGLGFEINTNCLFTGNSDFFERMGLSEQKYLQRWKGPYLENLEDYFLDGYGNPIIYVCWKDSVYLWSAGDDEKFDFSINLETNTGKHNGEIPQGQADDIVVMVYKLQGMRPSRLLLQDRILSLLASLPKKRG